MVDGESALPSGPQDRGDLSTLSELVINYAQERPGEPAYIEPDRTTSWAEYDRCGDAIARVLMTAGVPRGGRAAVLLPDTVEFHAALLGAERAGVVAVGIGARAGDAEITHLLRQTGATALITLGTHRGRDMAAAVATFADYVATLHIHVVLNRDGDHVARDVRQNRPLADTASAAPQVTGRATAVDELWALNSTSGTTGLPKCVQQTQQRWKLLSRLAVANGELHSQDVFLGAVPGPFGFGLWTAHVCPTMLGVPTVLLGTFDIAVLARMIETHRVTVLAAVSTQFRMLLNSPAAERTDLSSLRVLFTGGEPIGTAAAAAFEERTGAVALNFFGSNETGAISATTIHDPAAQRLATAGRVLPGTDVRLYDDTGNDITATGGPGQPGAVGPLLCNGYYADDAANAELYHDDGHMLMGDLVTIDDAGYVRLVGRKSDIIIRGGKNLSAVEMESAIHTHPEVQLAAVVSIPDEEFGERACAVVSTRDDAELSLHALTEHMLDNGMSKELLPEYLLHMTEFPISAGGKVAKDQVREIAVTRLANDTNS